MRYEMIPVIEADRAWLEQLRRSVYRDLFFATWSNWDEARHLRHCDQCWAIGSIRAVEVEGTRVGMLQLLESRDAVEVGEIQIAPEHQNKGIGTLLMRDIVARAHAERKRVVLSTGLKNWRALQLYRRLGFRQVGQTETHSLLECAPP
jgi:ribosomal protein S18 acetylase RimI-like enzyme